MRDEADMLFENSMATKEKVEEFIKEFKASFIEDEADAFNAAMDLNLRDTCGRLYCLSHLKTWWAYLYEVLTPEDVASELEWRAKNNEEYQLKPGDTQLCRVDLLSEYEPKQVVYPELAVESFRAEILESIDPYDDVHFGTPLVHYTEDRKSAVVYVSVSDIDKHGDYTSATYTYAIVCMLDSE